MKKIADMMHYRRSRTVENKVALRVLALQDMQIRKDRGRRHVMSKSQFRRRLMRDLGIDKY